MNQLSHVLYQERACEFSRRSTRECLDRLPPRLVSSSLGVTVGIRSKYNDLIPPFIARDLQLWLANLIGLTGTQG